MLTAAPAAGLGSYSVTVQAAAGGLTLTTQISVEVLASPPDLLVDSIQTLPGAGIEDQPLLISVTVRNQGSTPAGAFLAEWYADRATAPGSGDAGAMTWSVAGLAPGTSQVLTTSYAYDASGSYRMWAQVDRLNAVAEQNELNNVAGPVTVTVGSLPDLAIPSISMVPAIPVEGAAFTVTMIVVNQQSVDVTRTFQVDLYADPTTTPVSTSVGTVSWTQNGLAAGASAAYTATFTLNEVGIHSLAAQVDRLGQVTESDKTNNVANATLFFVDQPSPSATPLATPTPQPSPSATPAVPGVISPTVTVQGAIAANTTWTPDSVYIVVGQVTVNAGVVLTIQPGTVVKFQPQAVSPYNKGKLIVNGTLLAQGTADSPIVFTSIHHDNYGGDSNHNGGASWPQPGDWDGLLFSSTGSGTLEHVWLGYGGSDGDLAASGATASLRHAFAGYSASNGLRWMNGAGGEISDTVVEQNLAYGLYLTANSQPVISGNTFVHNGYMEQFRAFVLDMGPGGSMYAAMDAFVTRWKSGMANSPLDQALR